MTVNLPSAPNDWSLSDDGTSGNALSRLSVVSLVTVDFANPTSSFAINPGNATTNLAVEALPDFTAGLQFALGPIPADSVTFASSLTLAANNSLSVEAAGPIRVMGSSNGLTASGTGSITLNTAQSISVDANIMVVDGDMTMTAAGEPTITGTLHGIL